MGAGGGGEGGAHGMGKAEDLIPLDQQDWVLMLLVAVILTMIR